MSRPLVLDAVFVFLLVATAVTWALGEAGSGGRAAVALILGLALVKGWLIIHEFMALRRAPLFWRVAVSGWLSAVLGFIAATYWQGLA